VPWLSSLPGIQEGKNRICFSGDAFMGIDADIKSLLSLSEIKAIRQNHGQMSITRDKNGWIVSVGEDVGTGKSFTEALFNVFIRTEPVIEYKDWSPNNGG
jgi:hypothetical protein